MPKRGWGDKKRGKVEERKRVSEREKTICHGGSWEGEKETGVIGGDRCAMVMGWVLEHGMTITQL